MFFSNNINSQARIDPKLIGLQPDSFRFIVVILKQKADISNVRFIKGKENKTTFVYDLLLEVATKSQSNISSFLSGKNIPFRSFYFVNAFSLKADKSLITQLANFDEVDMIMEDGNFMMSEVQKDKNSDRTVTYGLNNIRAPQVWTQGFRGQNVVIGGQDTG